MKQALCLGSRRLIFAWVAMSCALISNIAAAGDILYTCTGLEEKSPYTAFGVKMYQGYDGWFFRKGDFETLYELPDDTLQMLGRINSALKAQGVHLILVPMLPRAIAGSAFVPNGGMLSDFLYDAHLAGEQFDLLIETIRHRGIDAVNINEILKATPSFNPGNYYFKRDIHWTPEGARLVAAAVADRIRSLQDGREGSIEFETTQNSGGRLHKANFNAILNELCQSKIPPEDVNIYETKQRIGSLDDLVEDETSAQTEQVHVVGSSYTDELTPYHFNGFLKQFLKQNVGGFSVSGGGVNQSIYAWAQNSKGIGKKPRFVVWEFGDLDDLRKLTTDMNDSIVPAIFGDCGDVFAVSDRAFEETDTIGSDLPKLMDKAADYYLRYEFSNKALSRFQLRYRLEDGSVRKVNFENPPRVPGLNTLYQSLPASAETRPVHVNLKIEGGLTSAGRVKLCRYPSGIISPTATSN
ncbi:hypothetical protein [Sinorhizobium sp. BJ1]|uniref:alginate O-acetyltransferase AlgX-related protein n=1 Tax=Sinorhizobium sp. BJ1 TaxID=2035455 RepID=UPI000BEACB48|nr:hypothetical protein [Sinorhizobium sp. BJ1]PDT80350.1 hypothetical protein CO676_28120 [Sinorhizobium sp. BJ1]